MNRRLAKYAKRAVTLLLTEMFVPGGTLIVLALVLAGRSSRWAAGTPASLAPFPGKNVRLASGSDLRVSPILQRLE